MTPTHTHTHTAWFLVGATATGKTAVANELARRTGCAIVSADSMLVYRGMNIGTAKPTADELHGIRFYGADLCNPDEPFSTGAWLAAVRNVFETAPDVIVAGGTGLYVNALIYGLDTPNQSGNAASATRAELDALFVRGGIDALHEKAEHLSPGALDTLADKQNPRRVIRLIENLIAAPDSATRTACKNNSTLRTPHSELPAIAGLSLPADLLDRRIRARVVAMFDAGLLDEVENLCARFPHFSETAGKGIGYAEALAVLRGELSRDEAVDKIALRTRQFAKRQRTWFRNKLNVAWVDAPANEADVPRAADDVMKVWREYGKTPVAL